MFWKKKRTYLDYAAGVAGLARGRSTAEGNPSSPHEEGRRAKKMLEDARTSIARLLEVQSDDVIFTSGATEANALAILGTAHARAIATRAPVHMLYLPSAHASIVENAKMLATYGATADPLPIQDYRVDTEALAKMLRPETVIVSMDAVCGETGVIWNTREVKQTIGKSFLHVDASQAPMTEKMTRAHFGADMLTLDASKVGDVRGIGALIAHRTIPIIPLYKGGGQERGLRSGSEASELAEKFATCLRQAALGRETFCIRAKSDRDRLVEALTASIPNLIINEGKQQAPHILNLSLSGRDTDYLVALMDEEGFAISTRSACETDSEEGSRAVLALTGDSERAKSTLRVSWGPSTRSAELNKFVTALVSAVRFVDNEGVR